MSIYPMCKPQPAQIDCRKSDCRFHVTGKCTNEAPAITLNADGIFWCWAFENKQSGAPLRRYEEILLRAEKFLDSRFGVGHRVNLIGVISAKYPTTLIRPSQVLPSHTHKTLFKLCDIRALAMSPIIHDTTITITGTINSDNVSNGTCITALTRISLYNKLTPFSLVEGIPSGELINIDAAILNIADNEKDGEIIICGLPEANDATARSSDSLADAPGKDSLNETPESKAINNLAEAVRNLAKRMDDKESVRAELDAFWKWNYASDQAAAQKNP